MKRKLTIIGTGNGAIAAAAHMSLIGHEVTLYANERYKQRMKELHQKKEIELDGVSIKGVAKIHKITHNIKEAMQNEIIMPIIPAYGQKKLALELKDYITNNHKLILAPGSTGGALYMAKIFNDYNKIVKIAEMHTLPYAVRMSSFTKAYIYLECDLIYFSAFPSKYNEEMYEITKDFYPNITLVDDVLECSLNNGNPISHPAPMVLNAGKIEYGFKHYHYKEGITPSVARVNQQIDLERQEICKRLGYKVIDVKERLYKMGYAPKRDSLYEAYRDSQAFSPLEGPYSLENRYLTEDTPCSLVLLSYLAKLVGVETKAMDSIINIASILMNEDYFKTGRNLFDLGIEDKNSLEELKEFLFNGYEEVLEKIS